MVSMNLVKGIILNADLCLLDVWTSSYPAIESGAVQGILRVRGIFRKD